MLIETFLVYFVDNYLENQSLELEMVGNKLPNGSVGVKPSPIEIFVIFSFNINFIPSLW